MASQPLYVGIPKTTFVYDIKKTQLHHGFWEDYNLTNVAFASAVQWNTIRTALASGDKGAFTWKEGLAKAAAFKNDYWYDCKKYNRNSCANNGFAAPILPDGSTPMMRAGWYGKVTAASTAVPAPAILEMTIYEVEEMFYVLAFGLISDRQKHVWGARIV